MKRGKNFLLDRVRNAFKNGKNPVQISKEFNISKQNLNYYVGKLKKEGDIRKVAYGNWEFIEKIKRSKNLTMGQGKGSIDISQKRKGKKEIRGHAFIWRINFPDGINWEPKIQSSTIRFQRIFNKKVLRIVFDGRKIWLKKNGLIIYEPLSFFGESSFKVKGNAVYEMDRLVKRLLKRLNIRMLPYKFTTSREHFGQVENELARQHNDKKEKLAIKREDGSAWLWIDDSLTLGELETDNMINSRQVQTWWNNHREHKFKVTPDFILNGFAQQQAQTGQIIKAQTMFAENIKSHVGAIQELAKGVKKLTQKVDELKNTQKGNI